VWHALEPALKEQINAIRTRVREEREAKNATPGSDNTSSDSKIPAQYPNMRANLVERNLMQPNRLLRWLLCVELSMTEWILMLTMTRTRGNHHEDV
jgi:hypothetical protein